MTTNLDRVVLIAVAGDSGCGKSTFLRRLTDLFGEEFMTVICLDDYHSLDRKGRKAAGVTALNPKANNFDLMYEQIKALKSGQAIDKPIYAMAKESLPMDFLPAFYQRFVFHEPYQPFDELHQPKLRSIFHGHPLCKPKSKSFRLPIQRQIR